MFGKRSRPVDRLEPAPIVDDAEVASSMARLADAFVAGLAADGYRLGYAPDDAYALDAAVDRYLATLPGYDARRGYAFSLGAYLGELVIRTYGGHVDPRAGQWPARRPAVLRPDHAADGRDGAPARGRDVARARGVLRGLRRRPPRPARHRRLTGTGDGCRRRRLGSAP